MSLDDKQSDDDDLELGEASLQSEEAVSTTVSEMVQSHLDEGGTLWTVVWALAGRARWKRLVAVAVVAQLFVPIVLVYENWPAEKLCPMEAPSYLRGTATALTYVLYLTLKASRDEVYVLRYLRLIFARKNAQEPGFKAAYLTAGIWAAAGVQTVAHQRRTGRAARRRATPPDHAQMNSLCSSLVVLSTCVMFLAAKDVVTLLYNARSRVKNIECSGTVPA